MIHLILHFLVPLIFAFLFYREQFVKSWLVITSGILIDIDHLLATPIFVADRCSIDFHLLHTYPAIGLYFFLLFFKKTRLIAIGLVIHIILDAIDCLI